MNPEVKKKWVEALRSGEYKQCRGALFKKGAYCCLGVLREIAPKEMRNSPGEQKGFLSKKVRRWAGLNESNPIIGPHKRLNAVNCNDNLKMSFVEIADLIEENL